nr:MAG TPA: DNA ligase-like protein [Caudoviricetes sp.]
MEVNYLQGLTFAIGAIKNYDRKTMCKLIEDLGGICYTDTLSLTWKKIDFIVGSEENLTKMKRHDLINPNLSIMITEDMFIAMIKDKIIENKC